MKKNNNKHTLSLRGALATKQFRLRWIPAFAGMTLIVLAGCKSVSPQPLKPKPISADPNRELLPDQFPVYVLGTTVMRLPPPGPFPRICGKNLTHG